MRDPKASVTIVISTVAWVLGACLVLLDLLWMVADDLGHLGLLLACAGAVLNVRSMFCQQARHLQTAFELGRDAGRLEVVTKGGARRIH